MLMILARLVCSESFWAVVKVRSPHTVPEVCYIIVQLSSACRMAVDEVWARVDLTRRR